MAIKIYEQFAPFANPADGDYPYGSIKNDSIPGAEDGTPLDAIWANDYAGSDAELFAQAGIVPSGQPDKLGASQRVNAINRVSVRKNFELYSRSYAEAGYNLVDGSFEAGGTLANTNDVLLQERTGKAFSGPAGAVSAGTDPTSGGFVDRSGDITITLGSYDRLRTYVGASVRVYCTGRNHVFDGGGGYFQVDASDSTSMDNDGTIIVDAIGSRWKRVYSGRASILWWGADPSGVADSYAAIQKAIDSVYSLFAPIGTYNISSPLLLRMYSDLDGENKANTIINKTTATTAPILVTAPPLAGGYTGSIPANSNAIVVLGNSSTSRWIGNLSGFTLTCPQQSGESKLVEFGVVSGGVVSDSTITNNFIYNCSYAMVLPIVFASEVVKNRFTDCLRGFFINNGTSLTYTNNYSVKCRDYAHYIRDLKYSKISANACDSLNIETTYPDRTRKCTAYVMESLFGCTVENNGQEGTLGTNWELTNFDHSTFENNVSIRLGSDYIGTDEIHWLSISNIGRGSTIKNNVTYDYNAKGLLFGGADPAKHRNINVAGTDFLQIELENNVVRASRNGVIVEAGWLNNNLSTVLHAAAKQTSRVLTTASGLTPTLTVEAGTDAVITYGANNIAYRHYHNGLLHVFGVIDVTVTYTTGTSQRLGVGNIQQNNQANDLGRINVIGVDSGLTAFKAGKQPKSFRINSPGGGGVLFDVNGATIRIDDFISGQSCLIHYDGWYTP